MILAALLGLVALLFAAVGQAGAPGYVAIMGLYGFAPDEIKPVALALTALVAAIGVFRFRQMGLLATRDWLPYAIAGVPLAVLGGMIRLPPDTFRILLAVILAAAAFQMARAAAKAAALDAAATPPSYRIAVPVGGVIGFVAGLTGIGGGLFLAWIMMTRGWAPTKRVAAAAQVSNFITALPALIGAWAAQPVLPQALPHWALAASLGGFVGAWIGAKYLPARALRYLLAAILMASAVRLSFS